MNDKEFTKKLQKVIDYYGESASSFAEKINVQRSSISHILSGRNKPSLDFVMKITSTFPEVELNWLLNDIGGFPSKEKIAITQTALPTKSEHGIKVQKKNRPVDKSIDRIVIFYSDGSFENYQN
jgi:predicted transcriptional regulator